MPAGGHASTPRSPTRRSSARSREPLGVDVEDAAIRHDPPDGAEAAPRGAAPQHRARPRSRAASRWSPAAAPVRCTARQVGRQLGCRTRLRAAPVRRVLRARHAARRRAPRLCPHAPRPASTMRIATRIERDLRASSRRRRRDTARAEGFSGADSALRAARSTCATSASNGTSRCAAATTAASTPPNPRAHFESRARAACSGTSSPDGIDRDHQAARDRHRHACRRCVAEPATQQRRKRRSRSSMRTRLDRRATAGWVEHAGLRRRGACAPGQRVAVRRSSTSRRRPSWSAPATGSTSTRPATS